MSGPKVVVLVTREQMLEIADGLLKRLEKAIAAWITEGQGCGMLSDDEIAATWRRRAALAALVETSELVRLQKGVPDEIAFLKADTARRQQAAADKAEQAARRQRHTRHGAATVLGALEAKGIAVPAELGASLARMRNGQLLDDADAVLARAFGLLTPEATEALSAAQESLARALRSAEPVMDLQGWKAANAALDRDPAIARLDHRIGEANVHLGQNEAAGYATRLAAVEQEANDAHRRLLLDSLTLDLAAAIDAARKRRAAREALEELSAEMNAYATPEAAAYVEQAAQRDAATSTAAMIALIESGQALLAQVQQQQAAAARRRAILGGLAKLGYEVHEGMETAWANDGRVVIKKPSVPGYGVEVGGQTDRMQVRVVSTEANRDMSRDRDVESMWCGEFGQLQDLLATQGDELQIERALGVGAVPLKVVVEAEGMQGNASLARGMK
ncbi:hypothetical protein [Achromobacter aegrifaciens]|uniref:hypothetical protein n=1 Tax=Achromobacter aegrifaciens TaxID=1287736 RepID=UPI0028A5BC44|nr:hypothetical protein [Achromobacter aegrifaciens]